jgi:hypothetical protein
MRALRGLSLLVAALATTLVAVSAQADITFFSYALDTYSGTYTSPSGTGYITETLQTLSGGAAYNQYIVASQFPHLFPGSGAAPTPRIVGASNSSFTITFDLSHYTLSSATIFGLYNIIDSTTAVASYSIALRDASDNLIAPPFASDGWLLLGNDDDANATPARTHLILNRSTGTFLTQVYNPSGMHSDAAFWYGIPDDTRKIIITGTLGAGAMDGIGAYFAEVTTPTVRTPWGSLKARYRPGAHK